MYPKAEEAAPPYQPPYQSPPAQQPVTVITQPTTVVVNQQIMGDAPVRTQCPNCRQEIVTRTSHGIGTLGWIIVLILCLFGLVYIFMTSCYKSFYDVFHSLNTQ